MVDDITVGGTTNSRFEVNAAVGPVVSVWIANAVFEYLRFTTSKNNNFRKCFYLTTTVG
jgi:hypothetical protein